MKDERGWHLGVGNELGHLDAGVVAAAAWIVRRDMMETVRRVLRECIVVVLGVEGVCGWLMVEGREKRGGECLN